MVPHHVQCLIPHPTTSVTSIKYYLSLVPFVQALIADLKVIQRIPWAISRDSLCCTIHYFHFNKFLLGT